MRRFIKEGETWAAIEPLTEPAEILEWIAQQDQDGVAAIVVDDDSRVYYCNCSSTYNDYAAKGKKVSLFYYLALKLRKQIAAKPEQGSLL